MCIYVCTPLLWRLKIDRDGVSWRWLFLGDTWTWFDFESGWVEKVSRSKFYDATRSWGSRGLELRYLAKEDLRQVMAIINQHYVLPPAEKAKSLLTIQKMPWKNKAIHLSEDGIQLGKGPKSRSYEWSEVSDIHIIRSDAVRRDFSELVITVPDETTDFVHVVSEREVWVGASVEEINELLFKYAAAKIRVSLEGDPQAQAVQTWRELRHLQKSLFPSWILMLSLGALYVFCASWLCVDFWFGFDADGVTKLVVAIGASMLPLAGIMGALYFFVRRRIRRLRAEFEEAKRQAAPFADEVTLQNGGW